MFVVCTLALRRGIDRGSDGPEKEHASRLSMRAGVPMAFSYAYAYSTLEALCPIISCFLPEVKIR